MQLATAGAFRFVDDGADFKMFSKVVMTEKNSNSGGRTIREVKRICSRNNIGTGSVSSYVSACSAEAAVPPWCAEYAAAREQSVTAGRRCVADADPCALTFEKCRAPKGATWSSFARLWRSTYRFAVGRTPAINQALAGSGKPFPTPAT